jgi:hypothetical protein
MEGRIGGRGVRAALAAGLVGAVTVEVYLFAVGLASWPGTYQWIASALAGKAAYASMAYAWLGVAIHVGVSVGWALGWAFVGRAWPRLHARPVGWGLAYGLVVLAAMQGVAAASGIWAPPTLTQLAHYVLDHALFFGAPLAIVFGRMNRGRAALAMRAARSVGAPAAAPLS